MADESVSERPKYEAPVVMKLSTIAAGWGKTCTVGTIAQVQGACDTGSAPNAACGVGGAPTNP